MSKDPAVLWYSNDFISGTYTMTDEQVGKYVRLLCLQHQNGFLTKQDMEYICKTYDLAIYRKFIKEGDIYYNKRMRDESERRQKYSESRKTNRLSTKDKNSEESYVEHMETITVNENVNKDKIIKKAKKILFKDSEYYDYQIFRTAFYSNPKYTKFDAEYYYEQVKNWSANDNKKVDWIATVYNWCRKDEKNSNASLRSLTEINREKSKEKETLLSNLFTDIRPELVRKIKAKELEDYDSQFKYSELVIKDRKLGNNINGDLMIFIKEEWERQTELSKI